MNFLTNLFKAAWSFLFGGGTVIAAVDDGIKLADDVVKEQHDKNQRDAGAAEQVIASEKATQDTLDRLGAPISDAGRDKLWDRNAAKDGAD